MKTKRTLTREEWNDLRYDITLRELSEEEGGGWLAWIPLLGRGAFMVDAQTPEEAARDLEELRRSRYDMVIESGADIPLPESARETREMPSGKWSIRTSPQQHKRLQIAAEKAGMSLNAYCNALFERDATAETLQDLCERIVRLELSTAELDARQTEVARAFPGARGWAGPVGEGGWMPGLPLQQRQVGAQSVTDWADVQSQNVIVGGSGAAAGTIRPPLAVEAPIMARDGNWGAGRMRQLPPAA